MPNKNKTSKKRAATAGNSSSVDLHVSSVAPLVGELSPGANSPIVRRVTRPGVAGPILFNRSADASARKRGYSSAPVDSPLEARREQPQPTTEAKAAVAEAQHGLRVNIGWV